MSRIAQLADLAFERQEQITQLKDRIAELEAIIRQVDTVRDRDSRIAELKADIDGLLEGAGATERGFSKRMAELETHIAELEAWKESALSVMPDFQAISKALGLKPGTDVSPQILPRIKAMTQLLDAVSNLEHHEFKRRWDELKSQP